MAQTIGNLLAISGLTLQGDVAGLTTYTSKRRRIVFFPQAPPLSPPTWYQSYQRQLFANAATAWSLLTQAERNDYMTSCRFVAARITGYNLWMKISMTRDDQDAVAVEAKTGIPLARPWPSV
jgi:hypothetical protein